MSKLLAELGEENIVFYLCFKGNGSKRKMRRREIK
jgi:hypothetical protein